MKNDYEIRGEITAIFLKRKNGSVLETIINTSDLDKVKEFSCSWYAHWNRYTKSFYSCGNSMTDENGKRRFIRLHRWITDVPSNKMVDHINHNTLDNTRSNLRIVTHAENQQNRKGPQTNNTAGIRGVHWNKDRKKWHATIVINKQQMYLGLFENKEDAEKVVIEARKKYMPYSVEV